MHPLSLFPDLFTFQLLAPFLLRLVAGYMIILFGWERYHKKFRWTSLIYLVTGILLLLGLYTQAAAIAGILLVKFDFWTDRTEFKITRIYVNTAMLVSVILLSLLFTGPGLFGFDLPL